MSSQSPSFELAREGLIGKACISRSIINSGSNINYNIQENMNQPPPRLLEQLTILFPAYVIDCRSQRLF